MVLGCVVNEGYVNRPEEVEEFCIFNRNQNACSYAVSVGALCFFCSAAFLALDVYFPQISGVKDRKKAVMADIAVSGEVPPLPGMPSLSVVCNHVTCGVCSFLVSGLVPGLLHPGQSVAGFQTGRQPSERRS